MQDAEVAVGSCRLAGKNKNSLQERSQRMGYQASRYLAASVIKLQM